MSRGNGDVDITVLVDRDKGVHKGVHVMVPKMIFTKQ